MKLLVAVLAVCVVGVYSQVRPVPPRTMPAKPALKAPMPKPKGCMGGCSPMELCAERANRECAKEIGGAPCFTCIKLSSLKLPAAFGGMPPAQKVAPKKSPMQDFLTFRMLSGGGGFDMFGF